MTYRRQHGHLKMKPCACADCLLLFEVVELTNCGLSRKNWFERLRDLYDKLKISYNCKAGHFTAPERTNIKTFSQSVQHYCSSLLNIYVLDTVNVVVA